MPIFQYKTRFLVIPLTLLGYSVYGARVVQPAPQIDDSVLMVIIRNPQESGDIQEAVVAHLYESGKVLEAKGGKNLVSPEHLTPAQLLNAQMLGNLIHALFKVHNAAEGADLSKERFTIDLLKPYFGTQAELIEDMLAGGESMQRVYPRAFAHYMKALHP